MKGMKGSEGNSIIVIVVIKLGQNNIRIVMELGKKVDVKIILKFYVI